MEEQSWQRVDPTGAHNKKREQVVGYLGESNRTAVLTEERAHGKVGHRVVQWAWESGVLIVKQLFSCQEASSIGDIPATCCRESRALRAAATQESRETRIPLGVAIS